MLSFDSSIWHEDCAGNNLDFQHADASEGHCEGVFIAKP
jgi:hypothetical protein